MSCRDFSEDSPSTASDHPSGLCAVCQQLDFNAIIHEHNEDLHVHIGPVQDILAKQFCPSCRVILSAIRSAHPSDEADPETTITIRTKSTGYRVRKEMQERELHREEDLAIHTMIGTFVQVCLDSDDPVSELEAVGAIVQAHAEEVGLSEQPRLEDTVFTPDDPPTTRGRVVAPTANIGLIKEWIRFCDTQHCGFCVATPQPGPSSRPLRLIDVQENRVVETSSPEKYIALSYIWGPYTKPLLNKATLSQYSSPGGLTHAIIPRTILDTMQLVRDIGERYVWVDSLCIIQDDEQDKISQIPIMDRIYNGAYLVVVAAAGKNAEAGLPGIQGTKRHLTQRVENIRGMQWTTTEASVRQVLSKSAWSYRGWTYQEAILSSRILIFTEGQVSWNCHLDTWREDTSYESSVYSLGLSIDTSFWAQGSRTAIAQGCRTSNYCRMVELFSQRAFTKESDVLWAFVGILKLLRSQFRKGYIWAHPYERLDATLLWSQTCGRQIHSRTGRHNMLQRNRIHHLPYPSWSWLSTNEHVSFLNHCGDSVVPEVKWHEPLKLEYDDRTSATYLKVIRSDDGQSEQQAQKDFAWSAPDSDLHVMDYGLLHFTAQTMELTLRRKRRSHRGLEEESDGEHSHGEHSDEEHSHGEHCGEEHSDTEYPDADHSEGEHSDGETLSGKLGSQTGAEPSVNEDSDLEQDDDRIVAATIHTTSGAKIGNMDVASGFFNRKAERSGEFILLSSNTDEESDEICKKEAAGLDCGNIRHVDKCKHIRSRNVMLIEWRDDIAYRRGLGIIGKDDWNADEARERKIVLG